MQRGILVFAISMMVAAAPLHAQGRGSSSAPKAPKTTVKSQPSVAKSGPKSISSKPAKVTTPKGQSSAPKVKSTTPKAKATTPKAKATTPKANTSTKTTSSAKTTAKTTKKSTVPTTTTTTSTPTGTTLTPVQQKLQKNTNLASKLQGRLGATTDLMTAAAGFRNLGQFVAAVNASYNHKLSFTELKIRMVDQGMSLGQAVKEVRALPTTTTTTVRSTRDRR
jgi:hypothetical protein